MRAFRSIASRLSRYTYRIWPMPWVWIAVLTAVVFSVALISIQDQQRRTIAHFVNEQSLLRQARIDLAKGHLHLTLADSPQSPFDRGQGLALLDQASSSLERALRMHRDNADRPMQDVDRASTALLSDFAREVAQFRRLLLQDERGASGRSPSREAELRIASLTLERHAEAVDSRTQQDLAAMQRRFDRSQAVLIWGSGILLMIITAAVYAGGRSRKDAEQALRRALGEQRESDRRKDEFLGVLSHELRNPLAPIRNSLFVLQRTASGGEPAQRAMTVIGRQVTQLTRLVTDLLEITRITQGKLHLQRERLALNEVVCRTVEDYRSEFEARDVRLELQLAEALFWVDGDAARIAQVVGNLLGNAVKFTPAGGRVEVTLQQEGSTVTMRMRDTGVGLAPELIGRLFQPFSQAPQTLARTQGGLGLGLALVKRLAELHGGSVAVTSPGLGKGSEFAVRLPLAAVSRHGPVATPAPSALEARSGPRGESAPASHAGAGAP